MSPENPLETCAGLPWPVLTVYVNTSGQDATRHPRVRPERTWLLDAADALRRSLSHRDKKLFERQVKRVQRFLEQRHPAERALVIFAGNESWHLIPLHLSVKNELYWGKPKIDPLLPLLNTQRAYGLVVVDHMAARYFEFAQAKLQLIRRKQFEIDASQWKRKEQARVRSERMQKPRGPLRDIYERRVEAQYKRLCHLVAGEAAAIAKQRELAGVFLVGPDRLIQLVREKIPHSLAARTITVQENLGRTSAGELQRRLRPLLDDYAQERQRSDVKLLQTSDRAAVTNPDEVLALLQDGRIRTLLVARDLTLGQCPKCKRASRAADRVCADCGLPRERITLGELLVPILAAGNVDIEFLNGDAAQLLLRTGGLGGWLRAQPVAAAV